jgi:hypothetical protein
MLPELTMLGAVWIFAMGGVGGLHVSSSMLTLTMIADGATLMAFSSLVDVASRLKKALPWWLGIVAGVGILAFNNEVVGMLGIAWTQGLAVFLPFAWSLFDRVRQLWTLPSAPSIEKIRRRTLTFDRLYVGIVIMALWIAGIVLAVISGFAVIEDLSGPVALIAGGTAFYAIAAYNAWRVYRPAFCQRPRSLLHRMDQGQATSLDPL